MSLHFLAYLVPVVSRAKSSTVFELSTYASICFVQASFIVERYANTPGVFTSTIVQIVIQITSFT